MDNIKLIEREEGGWILQKTSLIETIPYPKELCESLHLDGPALAKLWEVLDGDPPPYRGTISYGIKKSCTMIDSYCLTYSVEIPPPGYIYQYTLTFPSNKLESLWTPLLTEIFHSEKEKY